MSTTPSALQPSMALIVAQNTPLRLTVSLKRERDECGIVIIIKQSLVRGHVILDVILGARSHDQHSTHFQHSNMAAHADSRAVDNDWTISCSPLFVDDAVHGIDNSTWINTKAIR